MKAHFYTLSIVLWCLLCIWIFAPLQVQTDTPSFINAIQILLEDPNATIDRLMRLSKPLSLVLPTFLVYFGFSATMALILQQYLSLGIALWAIYTLYTRFYKIEKSIVYQSLLLYISSSVIMVYAFAALNDMPAWALTWCLILYAHQIFTYKQPFLHYVVWGIIAALGMFIKESILVAGVYVFLAILLNKNKSFLQKTQIYIAIGLPFLLILSLGFYTTKIIWGYHILDWMEFNNQDKMLLYKGESWLKLYIMHFARVFDLAWLYLPLAIFLKKGVRYFDYIYAIGALILFFIYPFVWAYMLERIMFMFAPFYLYLLTLGQYSLSQKNKKWANYSLYAIMLGNLLISYGTYLGDWKGILWYMYGFYALVFLYIGIKKGMAKKHIPSS